MVTVFLSVGCAFASHQESRILIATDLIGSDSYIAQRLAIIMDAMGPQNLP